MRYNKKLIHFLLISLIFPAVILAQEPNDGVLLTGLFTDSTDTGEQEVLDQGVTKVFNVRTIWTYDKTNIITGPLEALAALKGIASPVNGLEEPFLSEISGYQKNVIAHSAGGITAVNLAKQGKLWGDELYIVSPALISQDDLRYIQDLTAEGKGFKKIVLYTGDDMIPNFKEISINFKDYLAEGKINEQVKLSLTGEDLRAFLDNYSSVVKDVLGKKPVSITIYGDIPGNKFEIIWDDGTIESFNIQKDSQTGEDFRSEGNIEVVPLYEDFPHGRAQLELFAEFKDKYERIPGTEDLQSFKQIIQEYESKSKSVIIPANDPNEKIVSPEGDIKLGETLNYAINYENIGEGIAYGVYIADTLEEDLDDATLVINNGGIYDSKTRTITWFIGEVQSKQKGTVSFSINAKNNLPDNSEIINFATIYFPSVPQATRTNGTVNRIATTTIIDNVAPVTTASVLPSPNSAGWNNSDVTVTLTVIDNEGGSGINKTEYSFDGINWVLYISSFSITNEGMSTVYYKSTDNAGNIESPKTLNVKIDKTPPIIIVQTSPQPNSYGWNNTDVTASFDAADNLSGVATTTEPITVTTEGANQYVGGEAIDLADNKATTSISLNIDKTPPIVTINATPDVLWPPDHKLANVTISGEAADNLSGVTQTIFKVTDEYGKMESIISDFNTTIQLESWRNGNDLDGRFYIISAITKDKADNQVLSSISVICLHDQGKN